MQAAGTVSRWAITKARFSWIMPITSKAALRRRRCSVNPSIDRKARKPNIPKIETATRSSTTVKPVLDRLAWAELLIVFRIMGTNLMLVETQKNSS
jgi:hypothetical protein